MKDCTHCKHALWATTKVGRFHPSGDGRCLFPWKMLALPASMYWIGSSQPRPSGGYISRKKLLKDDCVYFADKESP